MSVPDSFAGHPQSVTEMKGHRAGDSKEWTPRDALISILRDLDEGLISPYALGIVYVCRDEGTGTKTHFALSSPDAPTTLGMFELAKVYMCSDVLGARS